MKTRLDKAIEYIRGYCGKNTDCRSCKLFELGNCSLIRSPFNWLTPEEKMEEKRGEK